MSTFDTTFALSGIFLWMSFGFLSTIMNCDIQRSLRSNPLIFHFVGLTAFFFLFTILDANNTVSVLMVWLKTMFVYVMFVLMTKSKWYFLLPVLVLLLLDQTQKKRLAFMKANQTTSGNDSPTNDATKSADQFAVYQAQFSEIINKLIIGLIIVGSLHYMYLQKLHFKSRFSFYKFFLTTSGCRV